MKAIVLTAALIGTGLVLAAARAAEADPEAKPAAAADEGKPQTVCPVMGGKINPKLYADVDGKRIYVCCQGCIPAIKKDPAKYTKKLEAAGVTAATVPDEHPGH